MSFTRIQQKPWELQIKKKVHFPNEIENALFYHFHHPTPSPLTCRTTQQLCVKRTCNFKEVNMCCGLTSHDHVYSAAHIVKLLSTRLSALYIVNKN